MTFLLIVAFIGLILFEVPGLIRDKSWRELAVYTFLMFHCFYAKPAANSEHYCAKSCKGYTIFC